MKKLYLLLLALPLMFAAVSCHDDDDDMPQVKISLNYENGAVNGSNVYVVKPDTLVIESVNVTAVRPGHVATCVGPVNYWLSGYPIGTSFIAPFGARIATNDLEVGQYSLTLTMGIAEEGYSLATAMASVMVNVVADANDIPVPATGLSDEMPIDFKYQ
ncbi:MAG: hypothetical protein NC111_00315 [Bacteroides sp.]|nr:hypothetical protein [Bacteroides sp.]MCM1412746.1 hypothetical protein [Bacteroides sp.]MCM1470960.1 hypothetical protein [Bacteroides sp.]